MAWCASPLLALALSFFLSLSVCPPGLHMYLSDHPTFLPPMSLTLPYSRCFSSSPFSYPHFLPAFLPLRSIHTHFSLYPPPLSSLSHTRAHTQGQSHSCRPNSRAPRTLLHLVVKRSSATVDYGSPFTSLPSIYHPTSISLPPSKPLLYICIHTPLSFLHSSLPPSLHKLPPPSFFFNWQSLHHQYR